MHTISSVLHSLAGSLIFIMKEIDRLGYTGFVGLEYWPTMDHAESLKRTLRYLKG